MRKGYDFDGWYTADGKLYDFSTPVHGPVDLYARWTKTPVLSELGSIDMLQTGDALTLMIFMLGASSVAGLLLAVRRGRKNEENSKPSQPGPM